MRSARDISGLKMADVVAEIRAYPLKDTAGDFAAWGPDPVVHAAKLHGYVSRPAASCTTTPARHGAACGLQHVQCRLCVHVQRGHGGCDTTECNKFTATARGQQFQDDSNLTLEKTISRMKGTPCVYGLRSTTTGNVKNEWWGQSTLNITDVSTSYATTAAATTSATVCKACACRSAPATR